MSSFPNKKLLTPLAVAFGGLPLAVYAFKSYRAWLQLGPGGLPYNVFGWLLNSALHLVARSDTRVPAPYKKERLAALYGTAGNESFFDSGEPLPPRAGPRPDIPGTVAPQRQMSEPATPEMLGMMKDFLSALAEQNPETIQLKTSGLEGPYQDALWLADGFAIPKYLKGNKGEFVHPHGEGSSHVTLSLADAAKVIELGWAERHKLSGVGGVIPWGYVLVYAPRDEEEFGVWMNIVVASMEFVTAGSSPRAPRA